MPQRRGGPSSRPPQQDRTPFAELVQIAADFLRHEVPACPPTRPVYVLGESFGGLLALALAAGALASLRKAARLESSNGAWRLHAGSPAAPALAAACTPLNPFES